MLFPANVRLLVSWILRSVPVGTVMITGDQPVAVGFNFAQVAVEPTGCVASQLYPHIGTDEPSGRVSVVPPALKLTCCWARAVPAPRRRASVIQKTVFRFILPKWDCIALLLN